MDARERLLHADYTEDLELTGEDLSGIDLSKKELFRATFKHCRLQESNWERARLEDCRFEGCDLTRMKPRWMGAHEVGFAGCKLMGVEWADLSAGSQLSFEDCNLRYASFVGLNLRKARLWRCRLTEANFVDCDLTEADFAGSDLTGAVFQGCQLKKADLSCATGVFLDPAKTRVKDAKIATDAAVRLALALGMRVPEWEVAEKKARREREDP